LKKICSKSYCSISKAIALIAIVRLLGLSFLISNVRFRTFSPLCYENSGMTGGKVATKILEWQEKKGGYENSGMKNFLPY